VLTLSTISLDSRTDLPKVKYATALDWFLLMSFFYCIATLLEFAGVHYFTKVCWIFLFLDYLPHNMSHYLKPPNIDTLRPGSQRGP